MREENIRTPYTPELRYARENLTDLTKRVMRSQTT